MRAKKEKSPHTFWAFLSLSLVAMDYVHAAHAVYSVLCAICRRRSSDGGGIWW